MASLLASAVVQARGQAMASSLEQLIHSITLTRIASLPLCRSFASGSAVSASAQQQEPQASTSYGGALEKLQRRRKQLAHRDDKKALAEYAASRAEEPGVGPKEPMRFVSTNQTHSPKAPTRRIPICFPDFTLQLMKLTDAEVKQVEKTGWLREAAFKTTPNMTKLEIKAILQEVYGMRVEAVRTINYMGRRYTTIEGGHLKHWRADDWKKAYVVFSPPPYLADEFKAARAAKEAKLAFANSAELLPKLRSAAMEKGPAQPGHASAGNDSTRSSSNSSISPGGASKAGKAALFSPPGAAASSGAPVSPLAAEGTASAAAPAVSAVPGVATMARDETAPKGNGVATLPNKQQ